MPKPVIVITGASQGIGEAIALVFAKEIQGCRLALVARSEKNLLRVAKACQRRGAGAAEVFPCDVTSETSVETMSAAVGKRFGGVDILVNNAGVFRGASFLELSIEEFDTAIATNLRSVFLVSRQIVPGMVKRGRGHVFNMSSIAGLQPYPNGTAYCAAKFGLTGLSKVMRQELKDKGVRVTTVFPGATVSPSWKESGVALDGLMPAEDVAQAFFDIYKLSERTVVEEIVLRPQRGDI